MRLLEIILGFIIRKVYRIEVNGLENYHQAGQRVVLVANHISFLDPLILAASFPDRLTFAINTYIAQSWFLKKLSSLITLFPMDPTNPLSSKALINYLKQDKRTVIFPEGRITVTGSLMKIYDGTGFIADKANASLLPVRIDGAQYSRFSRMRGLLRLKWFPKITVNILPPLTMTPPPTLTGRARREYTGKKLSEVMTNMMFETSNIERTLYEVLLDARKNHGGSHAIMEDIQRKPLTYNRLLLGAIALGTELAKVTQPGQATGLMLPNMNSTIVTFFGLQRHGRVPALLNYSTGLSVMKSSIETAQLKLIISSRQFIKVAKLEAMVVELEKICKFVYLEDIAAQLSWRAKLAAGLRLYMPFGLLQKSRVAIKPDQAAVILFTSGSEGAPKAVLLSHRNLLANCEQMAAHVDFNARDVILNVLPVFHSFGLTAATLLPVFSGIKLFLYASPLHYRVIPELAYEVNATILFGTNTFLAGYARYAHPYDFYSVRYAFAGAEKLQECNRKLWFEKFGVRVFEGYGATETSPVLAVNTSMANKKSSVGRFLPGIKYRLMPVKGVQQGGQLLVSGPNIMLGYFLPERPGQLVAPKTEAGDCWYDTGDIVDIDEEGFVTIKGRIKRFAKIAGEMISLSQVEELAQQTWPDVIHAAVAVADTRKGEKLVLATEYSQADRSALQTKARQLGIAEISIPRQIIRLDSIPLLSTGKINYPALEQLLAGGQCKDKEYSIARTGKRSN